MKRLLEQYQELYGDGDGGGAFADYDPREGYDYYGDYQDYGMHDGL